MSNFFLTDRIKETSRTVGLGNIQLDGAVQGFSAFEDLYAEGQSFYYAMTDGTEYEVGSGTFHVDGLSNTIYRHAVRTSNSDNLVNFSAGVKEVFVTYAGFNSVYSASGIAGKPVPNVSGVAFWGSNQILDYSPKIVFESGIGRLGINDPDSLDASITVGGDIDYSLIRASGFADGGSGILFSGVAGSFSGGVQLEPFLRNVADNTTGSDAVLDFGGLVDEIIKFKPQVPKTIFAGPTADCACIDDYPTFRLLDMDDLPAEILAVSGWAQATISNSGVAVSGWADATMTNRDNAVSGWADATMINRDNAVSGWADVTITNRDNAVSGWADVTITNRDNAVSGWALQTIINSGVAVSGWARVYVDNQLSGGTNHPYGDSGVRKLDDTYTLDPYNSGTLLRLGLNDDESAIVGISGGHGAATYTNSVFFGTKVAENSDSNICSVLIGNEAGLNASGNTRLIALGCDVTKNLQLSERLIAIGNEVANSGYNLKNAVFVGNLAGKNAFALSAESSIGIGNRSMQEASGSFAGTIAIGVQSCRDTVDVSSGIYIGQSAGAFSLTHNRSIGIGAASNNMAQKIDDGVAIGRSAGLESSGIVKSVYIGADAGAFSSGTTNYAGDFAYDNIAIGNRASFSGVNNSGQIAFGYRTAEQASGVHNIYMGQFTGFKRSNRREVIIKTVNTLTEPTLDSDWRNVETTGTLDIQEAIQGFVRHPDGGNTSLHLGRGLVAADTTDRIGPHNTVSIGADNANSVALQLWGFDSSFVDLGTQSSGLLATRPTLTNRSAMTLINGSGFLCTNDGTGADGSPNGVAIFNKRTSPEGNYLTFGGEEIATENIAGTIIPCRYGYDSGIAISTGSTWMFISGILI
jgi:hypothetical protein